MAALVAPLVAALTPLLSLNYWFARKPEQEPALAGVLLSFFLVQIFPIFGLAYAAVLIPALKPISAADTPAYMIAALFGGLIAGSLLARWLLRRMTDRQIRGLLLPSVVREGRPPDLLVWTGLVLVLGASMWLERFRGEWVAWTMQVLGILAMFQFVWWIYRQIFTPPGTVDLAPDTFQIPSLSMVRVGIFLWVLMSLSAIAIGLIRVIW